ncbi:MAG: GntR family transcriptional regulator, partial [Bacillota bacterium]
PGYTISPLVSFTAEMEERGLTTTTRVLEFMRLTPDTEASEKLQMEKQQEIYLIKRLRLVEGAPFLLEQVHLPVQHCPQLQPEELENNSLYQILKDKYYHQLSYAEATVEPVKLKGNPAHRLEVEPGSLGLLFYQTTFLNKGRPIEWTRAYYRSQDHKFSFKFGEKLVNNFKEV